MERVLLVADFMTYRYACSLIPRSNVRCLEAFIRLAVVELAAKGRLIYTALSGRAGYMLTRRPSLAKSCQ